MAIFDSVDPESNYNPLNISCNYHDRLSLKNYMEAESGLNIISANIRSAQKNFDELLAVLNLYEVKFHIIILCETWLSSELEWIPVAGFTAFHSIRHDRRGGGVTILVSDVLKCNIIPALSCNNEIVEMCSVDIRYNCRTFIVVGIYRPPSCSVGHLNDYLLDLFNRNATYFSKSCIIAGDMNVDLGCEELGVADRDFIDLFHANNYLPAINIPTRVTSSSLTIIDHIWTNILYFRSGVITADITDHYPAFIVFPQQCNSSEIVNRYFRCHKPDNLEVLRCHVSDFANSFRTLDDLESEARTLMFCNRLYEIYDIACPIKLKKISLKRATKPWLDNSLLLSIDRKHQLYREICSGHGDIVYYKRYRNILTNTLRDAKRKYFNDKFSSNYGDSKSTWRIVNHLVNSKSKQNSDIIVKDSSGNLIGDPKIVAGEFNSYFSSVAAALDSNIPRNNVNPVSYLDRLQNSFVFFNTSDSEVCSIIKSFKGKGSHLGAIPPFIYKHIADLISPIISNLINSSFTEGTFPNVLKLARVIPIYKSGPRDVMSNYRPISTLHFISKVFEKLVDKRLRSFFSKYGVLSENQYGFRRGMSTADALLRFTNDVYDTFNNNMYMIAVFIDLSKAFDTVRHDILIEKLEFAGVRGQPLNWFKSYLTDRQQYVDINGAVSGNNVIDTGVPQGSTLGPLLFNLYINDMSKSTSNLQYINFADDTTVYISGSNLDELSHILNSELSNLDQWLQSNRLSLNLDKTSYMIFSNKNKIITNPILIRNSLIEYVSDTKFLGIIVDDRLSFCKQINQTISKISKTCGVLRRLFNVVPSNVIKTLYYSLVYPYLIYGLPVWGSGNLTPLNRLRSLQMKCVKLISPITYIQSDLLFKELHMLVFDDIYKYVILLKFFQYKNYSIFKYFNEKIAMININHDHSTRMSTTHGLMLPIVSKSRCCRSFLFQSVKFWNELSGDLRAPMTYSRFKRELKCYLIDS